MKDYRDVTGPSPELRYIEEKMHKPHQLDLLIKAAPDLLAACEAVAGVFQEVEDAPLYARKCISAIAKAKGKA